MSQIPLSSVASDTRPLGKLLQRAFLCVQIKEVKPAPDFGEKKTSYCGFADDDLLDSREARDGVSSAVTTDGEKPVE